MENASKALILAGSVLVAIMVISLGVVIFRNMSGAAKEQANLDEQVITTFNADITPYLGTNVSGSQVNTLRQLVISINNKAKRDGDTVKRVSMILKNGGTDTVIAGFNATDGTVITGTKVETGVFYTVQATRGSSGLINTITVTQN